MRALPLIFCSFLIIGFGQFVQSTPVHGQTSTVPKRDEAQRSLRNRKQDLEKTLQQQKQVQKDVVFLKKERARLNRKLVDTAGLVKQGEARLSQLEDRLGELNEQEKLVRGSLKRQHGTLKRLLAAMQRMGRNPPPVVVTRRDDALDMVRSAMMLAKVFPKLRGKALALGEKLSELQRIMTITQEKRDRLSTENKRLADTRLKLKTLVAEKQNTISMRHSELVEIRQAAERLSRSVTDLNVLISKLDEVVADKSKLGEYQRELAQRKAESDGPDTKPAQGKKAPKIADKQETPSKPAVELRPSSRRFAMLKPGRLKPTISFRKSKGSLLMPASGRHLLKFGDKTRFGTKSKGIAIATRPAAQITSPSDGWVVFAGPFRSYGQLLIINGGGGYHVLLAGLSQIDVSLGQFVIKGEPVGIMGERAKTSQPESGQDANPVLYVELRKKGQPINPKPWWARETKKVQG